MLTDTVKQLQQHKTEVQNKIKSLEAEINKIDEAITVLASVGNEDSGAVVSVSAITGRTRNISAAGIARIRAAQKLRWSKFKKNGGSPKAKASGKAKPNFSAAGIARIKAAQKARWARFKAAKEAAATEAAKN